jgi:hypothetical protein
MEWTMRTARRFLVLAAALTAASAAAQEPTPSPDLLENRVVPVFMGVMALGITGVWTTDIARGRFADRGGFFSWREGENLLWPHILAEYLTAAGLAVGAVGLYRMTDWSVSVSLVSLGALVYTAINSTAWVLAERERIGYGVPMWIGLAGGIASVVVLVW